MHSRSCITLINMSGTISLKKLLQSLKTLFLIILSFILMYSMLLIWLIPLTLLLCYRLLLSLMFLTFYKGKIKLLKGSKACFATDSPASVYTMTFFTYINGPCDIDRLRNRITERCISFKDKNGRMPYKVLQYKLKEKFGYYIWEDGKEDFDIKERIRFLPGCSDLSRVYTEREMFEGVESLIDKVWDENNPRWEFLVVNQFQKPNESALVLRIHHSYMDGISVAQFVRFCIADSPAPKLLVDPVQVGRDVSFIWKLFVYFQVFLLGPWATFKTMTYKANHKLYEGYLKGGKFYGRTTKLFPFQKMKQVRKKFNCSTSAIQHYAFTSALRNMIVRKGITLPDEVLATFVFAMFPYPSAYPKNNVTFSIENVPFGFDENAGINEKISSVNKVCASLAKPTNQYKLVTSTAFLGIFGLLPVVLTKEVFTMMDCFYLLSNVPGIKDRIYFDRNNVRTVFGVGPLVCKLRYGCGVTCYENNFTFGFAVEKSLLIQNREDFEEMVREVENELTILVNSTNDETV